MRKKLRLAINIKRQVNFQIGKFFQQTVIKGISSIARRVPADEKLRSTASISNPMKEFLMLGKTLHNPTQHITQSFTIDLG